MTSLRISVLVLLGISLSGCTGAYTSIRKVDDNTYDVTRTKNGFFRTTGTLFRCSPKPTGDLKCVEIDSP